MSASPLASRRVKRTKYTPSPTGLVPRPFQVNALLLFLKRFTSRSVSTRRPCETRKMSIETGRDTLRVKLRRSARPEPRTLAVVSARLAAQAIWSDAGGRLGATAAGGWCDAGGIVATSLGEPNP